MRGAKSQLQNIPKNIALFNKMPCQICILNIKHFDEGNDSVLTGAVSVHRL